MYCFGRRHFDETAARIALLAGAAGDSPAYQYLSWIARASAGLGTLCLIGALSDLRRYGILFLLTALILFLHSTQPYKEYRYVFAAVPLWLLAGAGVGDAGAGVLNLLST